MSRERPWERGRATAERNPGSTLVRLSWAGTLISCATSIANAATGSRREYWLSAAPALVLLALGCVAFLWAFAVAVERSRTEEIGVGGLFFLEGCAPRRAQLVMMASVAVQTVVPLVVAIIRPFTAFAVLAPVWSLGLAGLWGARHGTFPPRRQAGASQPTDAEPDRPDSGDG